MNLTEIISVIPINAYVVIGCCIFGWLMKKFLPTDNRIIPVTLTVIGALIYVLIECISVENIIIGAFTGAASTGLHQIFAQYIEGTKDRDEDLIGAYAYYGEYDDEISEDDEILDETVGGGDESEQV